MKAKEKKTTKDGKKKRVLPLTKKQEAYCRARAEGATYRQAYKEAGYKDNGDSSNGGSAYTLEHLSAKTKEILARIAQLKEQAEAGAIMDRQARQAMLTQLANDEEGARADRIRAIDLLCKMSGDYTERVIYEGTASVSIEDARKEAWDALRGNDETRE